MPSGDLSSADRTQRAVDALRDAFRSGQPVGPALDRAVEAYRDAVWLALYQDPGRAIALVDEFDQRIPAERYPFGPDDRLLLEGFEDEDDADFLSVTLTLACRIPLPAVQRGARDRLIVIVGKTGRAASLVRQLRRFRAAGLLDQPTLSAALVRHLDRARLDDDAPLWRDLLRDLPGELIPDISEVHRFLGGGFPGGNAGRPATTPAGWLAEAHRTFPGVDLDTFWEDSEYAERTYLNDHPSDELITSVEAHLGHRLPASYVTLMRTRNGGIPRNTHLAVRDPTRPARDHVSLTGIMGIGREKPYSLAGATGSRFWPDEWCYPLIGVYFATCPSGGHDMIAFDYRGYRPGEEPSVVQIAQEHGYHVTVLAPDFVTFVQNLRHWEDFD